MINTVHSKSLPVIVQNAPSSSSSKVFVSSQEIDGNPNNALPSIYLNTRPAQPKIPSRQQAVISEHTVVVGTKDLHNNTSPTRQLTREDWDNWNTQQIAHPAEDTKRTKLEWENDIARHILSVYASTNVMKSLNESHALLDFVADKVPKQPLTNESDITNHYPAFQATDTVPPNETKTQSLEAITEEDPTKSSKKKKKKPKKSKIPDPQEKNGPRAEALIDEKFIAEFVAKIEKNEFATKTKDKYRVTNTIKAKNGQTIVIRGNPRVFPIWFVPSGDIYANWTALPGGRKLQAHVNVLYERGHYMEYLSILEEVILTLWRERMYGVEDFVMTSFGKDDPSSRLNTANTDKSSRSRGGTGTGTSKPTSRSKPSKRPSGDTTGPHTARLDLSNNDNSGWYDHILSAQIPPRLHEQLAPHFQHAQHTDLTASGYPTEGLLGELASTATVEQSVLSNENTVNTQGVGNKLSRSHGLYGATPTASLPPQLFPTVQHEKDAFLPPLDNLQAFWRQLILTCTALGTNAVEKKQFDRAMEFFNRAEVWANNDDVLPSLPVRRELKGYVKDAMAFYFYRKGKAMAAMAYANQAREIFETTGNLECIAACLLHTSAVYCQLGEFKQSHCVLYQFLAMIEEEDGRLAHHISSPRQLCLVAIGYHNLAVLQLKLNMPDFACKSSQNARKLARLCLSYSNRWIDIFQYTHEVAVADMKYELTSKSIDQFTEQQLILIRELAGLLFQVETNSHETL